MLHFNGPNYQKLMQLLQLYLVRCSSTGQRLETPSFKSPLDYGWYSVCSFHQSLSHITWSYKLRLTNQIHINKPISFSLVRCWNPVYLSLVNSIGLCCKDKMRGTATLSCQRKGDRKQKKKTKTIDWERNLCRRHTEKIKSRGKSIAPLVLNRMLQIACKT